MTGKRKSQIYPGRMIVGKHGALKYARQIDVDKAERSVATKPKRSKKLTNK